MGDQLMQGVVMMIGSGVLALPVLWLSSSANKRRLGLYLVAKADATDHGNQFFRDRLRELKAAHMPPPKSNIHPIMEASGNRREMI